jgi:predicted CopG family antitoxin
MYESKTRFAKSAELAKSTKTPESAELAKSPKSPESAESAESAEATKSAEAAYRIFNITSNDARSSGKSAPSEPISSLLYIPQPNSDLFFFQVYVNIGFDYNSDQRVEYDESTVNEHAHFLEHIQAYYPSSKYPDEKANFDSMTKLGVMGNAETHVNKTIYYQYGLRKHMDYVIDIMLSSFGDFTPTADSFEREQSAVLSELNSMNTLRRMEFSIIDKVLHNSSQANAPIKTRMARVKTTTLSELMEVHRNYYTLDNMFFVLSANLANPDTEIRAILDKITHSFAAKKFPPKHFVRLSIHNNAFSERKREDHMIYVIRDGKMDFTSDPAVTHLIENDLKTVDSETASDSSKTGTETEKADSDTASSGSETETETEKADSDTASSGSETETVDSDTESVTDLSPYSYVMNIIYSIPFPANMDLFGDEAIVISDWLETYLNAILFRVFRTEFKLLYAISCSFDVDRHHNSWRLYINTTLDHLDKVDVVMECCKFVIMTISGRTDVLNSTAVERYSEKCFTIQTLLKDYNTSAIYEEVYTRLSIMKEMSSFFDVINRYSSCFEKLYMNNKTSAPKKSASKRFMTNKEYMKMYHKYELATALNLAKPLLSATPYCFVIQLV